MSDEDLERLGRLGLLMDGLPMDVAGRLLNEFTDLANENARLRAALQDILIIGHIDTAWALAREALGLEPT